MVKADGKIADSEIALIQKLAQRMEVPSDELAELFKNPRPSKPLYSEVDRITHFYKLILIMRADQETQKAELAALKNFGLKMGIRPIVSDQILKKMEDYKSGIVPAEELLKIFKIYYN